MGVALPFESICILGPDALSRSTIAVSRRIGAGV